MPEWIDGALTTLKPYWPFLTQVIVIWYLGQFYKKRVWTKARAKRGGIFGFMRSTLPIHPLVAGALWGALYPMLPAIEWITTRGGAINAGVLAGAVSLIGHTALEAVAEARGWAPVLKVLREAVPDRESSVSSNPPPSAS